MALKANVTDEQVQAMYKPALEEGWYLAVISDAEEHVGEEKPAKDMNGREVKKARSYNWKLTFLVNKEPEALKEGWLFGKDATVSVSFQFVWITHVEAEPDAEGNYEMIPNAKWGGGYKAICRALGFDWKEGVENLDDLLGKQLRVEITHVPDERQSDEEGVDIVRLAINRTGAYKEGDETGPRLEGWRKAEAPTTQPY